MGTVREQWLRRTVRDALERNVDERPDNVFVTNEDGTTTTYGQQFTRAVAVANGLLQYGVKPGTAVATLMGNSQETVDLWFAASLIGAVYIPINVHYKGDFLRHPLAQAAVEVLVADEHLAPALLPIVEDLPALHHVVILGQSSGLETLSPTSFSELAAADSTSLRTSFRPTWRDVGAVIFTSGTTGPSKGNLLSHNYMMNLAGSSCDMRNICPHDVCYSPLPMFHLQPMLACLLPAQLVGAGAALDWTFSVSRYWQRTRDYGATHGSILGTMFTMLLGAPEQPDDADNPVRVMQCAPIPAELHREFERRFGVRLTSAYGTTETGTPVVSSWDEPLPPGFSGKASPWCEVRLVDEDDDEVPAGEIGELVCRPKESHVISEGYIGDPAATLQARRNLWAHTGDLLRQNEDGFFQFVDRKADYLRRRGENISSFEVERAILIHPAVADVAVHGTPSEVGEEEVKAWVVTKRGVSLTPEELLDHCVAHMPYFAVPRFIEFTDDLPVNPLGKVLKYVLRDWGNDKAFDREKAGYEVRRQDRIEPR